MPHDKLINGSMLKNRNVGLYKHETLTYSLFSWRTVCVCVCLWNCLDPHVLPSECSACLLHVFWILWSAHMGRERNWWGSLLRL